MPLFYLYFKVGFQHISDFKGYDHILFLLALCAVYSLVNWRKVLVLVTAFTIGHSVSLALSTFNVIVIKPGVIEFLIPLTIFITSVFNITAKTDNFSKNLHLVKYFTAMIFGLIHGLGFSNYLKSLLGKETNIVKYLLGFNLGLEAGQILIVLAVMGISSFFINTLKTKQREWNLVVSGATLGISVILMIERWPF
ncbi:MAG: HupE/UreJ family protein [Chlorobi bacterium]|nr:HupE/UreJ family protein [Chlorobiota bacterium]